MKKYKKDVWVSKGADLFGSSHFEAIMHPSQWTNNGMVVRIISIQKNGRVPDRFYEVPFDEMPGSFKDNERLFEKNEESLRSMWSTWLFSKTRKDQIYTEYLP